MGSTRRPLGRDCSAEGVRSASTLVSTRQFATAGGDLHLRMSCELSANVDDCSGRVGSAGIGDHSLLLGLVGSAGAVAAGNTVGLPALGTAVTVAGVAVGAFGG